MCGIALFQQLTGNNSTVFTGIFSNLANRSLQGAGNDVDTHCLVGIGTFNTFKSAGCIEQSCSAAWYDTFFNSSAGCVQGIVNAVFAFFHFNFRCTANFNQGNTASQFGQTFLKFLTVIVRRSFFDLSFDLAAACIDVVFSAGTVNDRCFLFGDGHCFGSTQHIEGNAFQFDAQLFGDQLTAGEDRNVFEHGFTAITEARCFNSSDFQAAAQLVDNQSCQGFAFDIFSNDQERLTGLNNSFEDRQHRLQVGQFLFMQQDERAFHFSQHFFCIGYEVR